MGLDGMSTALEFLTAEDNALLLEKGETRQFAKDDVILEEGDRRRTLYLILDGVCRVEQSHYGRGIAIAILGRGSVFGDMSFLEGVGANASVIADAPTTVLTITADIVNSLLLSVPGLATRFYQSLAVNLSKRLRETTAMFPKLMVEEVAEVKLFADEHTGRAKPGQLPPSLVADVEAFKNAMLETEQKIIQGKTDAGSLQQAVNEACEGMKLSLNKHIEQEAILDKAIGAYVLRETFPYFMAGRLTDRAYTKPRGYSGDYETIEIIYRNEAQGDGRVGPLIDRWVMNLASCDAVRNRRSMLSDLIRGAESQWAGESPMPVCSLASGPAREVFDLLDGEAPASVKATCLDIDSEAIGYSSNLAAQKGVSDRVDFALENVIRLALGRGRVQVGPQQVIYSTGLIDYLEERLIISLLDWAHDTLLPGGTIALGNFADTNPDKQYLDHVAEWILLHRTPHDLREMFSRSKFGATPVEILSDTSGVQLIAVAQKQ